MLRRAVPGVPASAFSVEADADGTLRVVGAARSAELGERRFRFVAKLPAGIDRGTLDARVVDGMLTITAAAPVSPERILVDVRSDVPAALPETEKPKEKEKEEDVIPVEDVPEDDETR